MLATRVLILLSVTFLCSGFSSLGGGKSDQDPLLMKTKLSDPALDMMNDAFDIGAAIVDQHLHLLGDQTPVYNIMAALCESLPRDSEKHKSAAWINDERFQLIYPVQWVQTKVLMDTVKASSRESTDIDSLRHLKNLVDGLITDSARAPSYDVRFHLLAIDGYYNKGDQNFDKALTDMVIPNDYVVQVAACLNSRFDGVTPFVPVISINPFKADAIKELKKYKDKVRYIKWVAPAMGFDPLDPYIDDFYKKVKEYGMVIMAHTGGEHAFDVKNEDFRKYGDPFRMRRALDFGIPVILSHAGGDDEKRKDAYQMHDNFKALMKDEKNQDQWCLFGDTSALTIKKNFQHFNILLDKFSSEDYKYRMLYGSDYPLPASAALFPLKALIKQGYIRQDQKAALEEIFQYNPLAFDITVKRMLASLSNNDKKLAPEMFMSLEENIKREMSMDSAIPSRRPFRKQCHSWYQEFVKSD